MKKMTVCLSAVAVAGFLTFVNAQPAPSGSVGGFDDSKNTIQANYDELYKSLPQDLQTRIKSAATTMENIRMMAPLESRTYLAAQRDRAEQFASSTISQLLLTDEAKTQLDNARKESCQQINDRMTELKARRAAHR
jgi:hypothetical protein